MHPDVKSKQTLNMLRKLVLVKWSQNKSHKQKSLSSQIVNTDSYRMIEETNKNEFK